MIHPQNTIVETPGAPSSSPRERFAFLAAILAAIIGILLGRSFYLQVVRGGQFRAAAEENRILEVPIPAPRGLFYDRTGTQLVENISSTDLVLDPALLPEVEHESYLIDRLPRLVPDLAPDAVQAALAAARQRQRLVPLRKALDHETILALEEAGDAVRGIRLLSSLARNYHTGTTAAHVLGYTGPVTSEELEQQVDLSPTDATGKTGLEKAYQNKLRGKHGVAYSEINAEGRPQQDLGTQAPQPGENMTLTIDASFQEYITHLFEEADTKSKEEAGKPLNGAVVAIDPRDGAVIALVSYPSFDPNMFSQPALRGAGSSLFTDERQPLFNRATDGMYPPGSIIKPFLAAGALDEGVITPSTTVLSTGGISVGPWHFPDWKPGGHGVTDVTKAIAESVNTFFYITIGGDATHEGMGVQRAAQTLSAFGWGKPTGIDLASEAAGFLPSKEWKQREKGESWYIGDTYHLAIGQGDVLVTPLQVAASTAAIANGGTWIQPRLTPNQSSQRTIAIDRMYLDIAREGMRRAVIEGSGRRLEVFPIALAGKTGTAQIGGSEDTHAWFTSFGPYEDPHLVITVLLERAGEGDEQAVPFAEKIWTWWVENRLSDR